MCFYAFMYACVSQVLMRWKYCMKGGVKKKKTENLDKS